MPRAPLGPNDPWLFEANRPSNARPSNALEEPWPARALAGPVHPFATDRRTKKIPRRIAQRDKAQGLDQPGPLQVAGLQQRLAPPRLWRPAFPLDVEEPRTGWRGKKRQAPARAVKPIFQLSP